MTFTVEGEYNTATVYTNISKEDAEDEAVAQIQTMMDHKSMEGEDDVAIMPDFHWGAGAVIGFTKPLRERVVPNTIGVDVGCGMYAVNFGELEFDSLEELDEEIRERVPTGFDVHERSDYHMKNDFPWVQCTSKLMTLEASLGRELYPDFTYSIEYFNDLCKRVGYDTTRAINSVGTLGGGNHFIELGRDSSGEVWCVIHSGSRGIGAQIAQYWQDRATDKMNERRANTEIPEEIEPYLGANWRPEADAIRDDFEGEEIQRMFDKVSQFIQRTKQSEKNRNTDLDYLEGDEMNGYLRDMIFAQTYASESRKQMARSVSEAIYEVVEQNYSMAYYKDSIESVHNYIDFSDTTIRKGACRAHEGERVVVPLNMSYGTIIAEGKGMDSWNNSSAHGAGRAMSRTAAKQKFDESDFEAQIGDVFMSKKPMDEIPGAYKNPEDVEEALGESLEVVERIKPFMSIKAE